MEIVANKEKPGLPRNLLTNSDGPNINENSVCRDFVCSPCFGALMAIESVFPDCEPALCEISHQFSRFFFGSCKIADFHSHFLVLGGSLIMKKKPLTPQAPRSGAKNMAKNDEKLCLLQFGACGSGRFSQPARYRVSCGLEMDVEVLSVTFVAFWAPRLGARPSKTPHEVVSWRCRLASGGKLASDLLFTSTRVHSNQSF